MGGRVEIESMTGIGTRMTVRLPLTLAILDGMSVAVGDQIYIMPLSAMSSSRCSPSRAMSRRMANQGRVIQVRNEYLPVVVLHEVFGMPGGRDGLHHGESWSCWKPTASRRRSSSMRWSASTRS
jgi:two-component system chemotaxis sensor kinase CheA